MTSNKEVELSKVSFYFFKVFLKKDFIYSERGEGREKERERNTDVREKHQLVASCTHHDWGLNQQPDQEP